MLGSRLAGVLAVVQHVAAFLPSTPAAGFLRHDLSASSSCPRARAPLALRMGFLDQFTVDKMYGSVPGSKVDKVSRKHALAMLTAWIGSALPALLSLGSCDADHLNPLHMSPTSPRVDATCALRPRDPHVWHRESLAELPPLPSPSTYMPLRLIVAPNEARAP